MNFLSQLIVSVAVIASVGCASTSTNVAQGVYKSPNGGFTYRLPDVVRDENIVENILPEGGNVQFYQKSHFKRIDYVRFSPTVEKEIQNTEFHKTLVKNFAMGTIVPAISQSIPGAEVKSGNMEDRGGMPVYYVSMLLPKASTMNGKKLDACRCMIVHTTAKGAFVFTVSTGIEVKDGSSNDAAFKQTEKWLKRELIRFFDEVRII